MLYDSLKIPFYLVCFFSLPSLSQFHINDYLMFLVSIHRLATAGLSLCGLSIKNYVVS